MQEAAKKVYEVQVAGLSLKLRSSHDAQTVSDLINLVDQKVKEAMAANSSASFQNALILATLNIAEELVLLKKTASSELGKVEQRARVILDRIEEVSPTTN
ncbi:MAG: cell division protein ZapA [Bdellovibrionales bacterium]|nr:cell division protein ZapA [Bdellovibrionales bacterium]